MPGLDFTLDETAARLLREGGWSLWLEAGDRVVELGPGSGPVSVELTEGASLRVAPAPAREAPPRPYLDQGVLLHDLPDHVCVDVRRASAPDRDVVLVAGHPVVTVVPGTTTWAPDTPWIVALEDPERGCAFYTPNSDVVGAVVMTPGRTATLEAPGLGELRAVAIGSVGAETLVGVTLIECPALEVLHVTGAVWIESLELLGVQSFADVEGLARFERLRRLALAGAGQLWSLEGLGPFLQLHELMLAGCESLGSLDGLPSWESLTRLDVSGCTALEDITALRAFNVLRELDLSRCECLADVRPLAGARELEVLDLTGCSAIDDLTPLMGLPALRELTLGRLPEDPQRRRRWLEPLRGLPALCRLAAEPRTAATAVLASLAGARRDLALARACAEAWTEDAAEDGEAASAVLSALESLDPDERLLRALALPLALRWAGSEEPSGVEPDRQLSTLVRVICAARSADASASLGAELVAALAERPPAGPPLRAVLRGLEGDGLVQPAQALVEAFRRRSPADTPAIACWAARALERLGALGASRLWLGRVAGGDLPELDLPGAHAAVGAVVDGDLLTLPDTLGSLEERDRLLHGVRRALVATGRAREAEELTEAVLNQGRRSRVRRAETSSIDLVFNALSPRPIAQAYASYVAARRRGDLADLVGAASYLVDLALRWIVGVLAADVAQQGLERPRQLQGLLDKLDRASWGDWCQAALALAKAITDPAAVTLPLAVAVRDPDLQEPLQELVALRNAVAHEPRRRRLLVPAPDQAPRWRELTDRLLQRLRVLRDLPVFVVEREYTRPDQQCGLGLSRLVGAEVVPLEVESPALPRLPERAAFMVSRRGALLLLDPWIVAHGGELAVLVDHEAGRLRYDVGDRVELLEQARRAPARTLAAMDRARSEVRVPVDVAEELLGPTLEQTPDVPGHYLCGVIGQGATASVYRAVDATGQNVAIKVLHADVALLSRQRDRFAAEVAALRALEHPNIVRVLGQGEAADGRPYLAMELARGRNLQRLIEQHGGLRPAEAAAACVDILQALRAVHSAGLVHRDVKPSNVVREEDGRHRLVDFGLVLSEGFHLSRSFEAVGTSAFAAPEQLAGRPVDARADLFAVGRLLMFSFTGGLRDRERDLPPALKQVHRRATLRDREGRYESAQEMLDAFDAARRQEWEGPPIGPGDVLFDSYRVEAVVEGCDPCVAQALELSSGARVTLLLSRTLDAAALAERARARGVVMVTVLQTDLGERLLVGRSG